jgi:hypothetical protein
MSWGGSAGLNDDQLVLIQNRFITQNNEPAIAVWTMVWGQSYPLYAYQGASPSVGNVWDETYSSVASIGNQFTTTLPFSAGTGQQFSTDTKQGTDLPSWAADPSMILQCGPVGANSTMIDNRTFCNFPGSNSNPVFNLLSFDDQLGVSIANPAPPVMPTPRPIVKRNYIIPTLVQGPDTGIAAANTAAIQTALNTLAANQANCAASDYSCADRWGILFLPSGNFSVSSTIDVPGGVQLQIVGTGQTNLLWLPYGGTATTSTPIFKLHAPSHVAIRDLYLSGAPDNNFPNPMGEGIVAEVTDLPTSRVSTEMLRMWGKLSAVGMGNATFDMRSFGNSAATQITGNGGTNLGYFAIFGGNPDNITVSQGANLMIQDSWYEGDETAVATCAAGDSGNIAIETTNLSPGGWHGTFQTPLTTVNIGGCTTKTVVMSSGMGRDGWSGLAPTASIVLPASAGAQTQLLSLANWAINSSYGTSTDNLPENYTGPLDQGYLSVDPATQAQYADVLGVFYQGLTDTASTGDGAWVAAKATGNIQSSFIRSMLSQVTDSRQMSPPRFVSPILDMQSTDIRIDRVGISGSRFDVQFILPGAPAQ